LLAGVFFLDDQAMPNHPRIGLKFANLLQKTIDFLGRGPHSIRNRQPHIACASRFDDLLLRLNSRHLEGTSRCVVTELFDVGLVGDQHFS
jgi:hypothetical protein